MYSVEDLFRSLSSSTAEDFLTFRKWLTSRIGKTSEVEQLEWILDNPNISNRAKRLLTEAVAKESSAAEDERSILLKVGHSTSVHRDNIEKTRNRLEEQSTKMRTAFFAMAAIFALIFSFICASYNGDRKDFATFMLLAMLFFGFTVVCLVQAWNASNDIKGAQEKAIQLENESVGRDLQKRMTAVEEAEEQLYELNKTIVKNSVKDADTNNTSVA